MESYISITEMARLRNITTETLRHYDRIGLLKPDYLDKNNVRYYSVFKYEQLETIKELQQLGLGLKEILAYLANRCISTSYSLLCQQQKICEEKIRYYQNLAKKITPKVSALSELKNSFPVLMKPELIYMDERTCLWTNVDIYDEISLSYACMKLENHIKEQDELKLIPIYASDCYAGQFSIKNDHLEKTRLLFIPNSNVHLNSENIAVLPAGKYLRLYSNNSFWQRTNVVECFKSYAQKEGLHLSDSTIVISKIDYSITDIPEERLYEFQIRVLLP